MTLTEPGAALARHAERIMSGLDAAEAEVRALADLRTGLLRIGWFTTAGATLMPRAIAAFRRAHPDVRLTLIEADPDDCEARLRERELDLALIYEFESEGAFAPDLPQVELLTDRLRVALHPDHRLAARRRLRLAELADEPWIQGVRAGSTLAILPTACRAAGFEPVIAFRTEDHGAVEGLVAAGVGVGPRARADAAQRAGRHRALRGHRPAARARGPRRAAARPLPAHRPRPRCSTCCAASRATSPARPLRGELGQAHSRKSRSASFGDELERAPVGRGGVRGPEAAQQVGAGDVKRW